MNMSFYCSTIDSSLSGVTSASDWAQLRAAPAPWAELEFDNIILTVPSNVVRDLEQADELAKVWNNIMKAVAELATIPLKFPRKERIVTDVQISHGKDSRVCISTLSYTTTNTQTFKSSLKLCLLNRWVACWLSYHGTHSRSIYHSQQT